MSKATASTDSYHSKQTKSKAKEEISPALFWFEAILKEKRGFSTSVDFLGNAGFSKLY